jgi:hypothetical protein
VSERRGRSSRPVLGSLFAVGLTVALGALAYGTVPGRVRVHWTLGTGPYVGPETLPRAIGLFAVPAVAVLTLAGLWALRTAVDPGTDPLARRYYDLAMLAVCCCLFAGQVVVVVANLV